MKNRKNKKNIKNVVEALKGQHAQFCEECAFVGSALPYIYKADQAADKVKKTLRFIEKQIIHIDKEEEKLFGILLSGDNLKAKQIVRELQHEHIQLLSIYDEIKDIVLNNGFYLKDKLVRDRFNGLVEKMVEFFLNHARKEDERLFPLFAGRNIKINLSL